MLFFSQGFVQIHGPVWHSQRRSPGGLCNSFQVNDLTFQRNASKKRKCALQEYLAELVLQNSCRFSLYILQQTYGWVVHISPTMFFNLSGLPMSRSESCQSREPIWNAVIWLDRNRAVDRVQRLHCVSGAQTDWGIDPHCEADAPSSHVHTLWWAFWQPYYKQSTHSRDETCLVEKRTQRHDKRGIVFSCSYFVELFSETCCLCQIVCLSFESSVSVFLFLFFPSISLSYHFTTDVSKPWHVWLCAQTQKACLLCLQSFKPFFNVTLPNTMKFSRMSQCTGTTCSQVATSVLEPI